MHDPTRSKDPSDILVSYKLQKVIFCWLRITVDLSVLKIDQIASRWFFYAVKICDFVSSLMWLKVLKKEFSSVFLSITTHYRQALPFKKFQQIPKNFSKISEIFGIFRNPNKNFKRSAECCKLSFDDPNCHIEAMWITVNTGQEKEMQKSVTVVTSFRMRCLLGISYISLQ